MCAYPIINVSENHTDIMNNATKCNLIPTTNLPIQRVLLMVCIPTYVKPKLRLAKYKLTRPAIAIRCFIELDPDEDHLRSQKVEPSDTPFPPTAHLVTSLLVRTRCLALRPTPGAQRIPLCRRHAVGQRVVQRKQNIQVGYRHCRVLPRMRVDGRGRTCNVKLVSTTVTAIRCIFGRRGHQDGPGKLLAAEDQASERRRLSGWLSQRVRRDRVERAPVKNSAR